MVFIIVAPNEVGNYRIIGSVCLYVCLYVCLSPTFFGHGIRELVFCSMVGYRSGTEPIDFGVIQIIVAPNKVGNYPCSTVVMK